MAQTIQVVIRGGSVEGVFNVPVGITVEVIDYDTQGLDSDILENIEGQDAIVTEWTSEGPNTVDDYGPEAE